MSYQFTKHYTRNEARALLPRVRAWLQELVESRARFEKLEKKLATLREGGADLGGQPVNDWVKTMASIRQVLERFQEREIQIKDVDRGLVDFPAIIGGKEVFLCWESGEEDIGFWHELDAGYAGREQLED